MKIQKKLTSVIIILLLVMITPITSLFSQTWQTIFFDNFNRANTANGDVGPNWIVDATGGSIMQILNNEVYSTQVNGTAFMYCKSNFNCSSFKISLKIRASALSPDQTIIFVATNAATSYAFAFGKDDEMVGSNELGLFAQDSVPSGVETSNILTPGTTYLFELTVINSTTVLKLYTNATIVQTLTTSNDIFPINGIKIGAGSHTTAIYIDNFKIEKMINSGFAQLAATPAPKFRINSKNTGLSSYGVTPPASTKSTVKTNWVSAVLAGDIITSPAIGSDGKIYLGTKGGFLYCFNPDGTINWQSITGDSIISCPAIRSDGKIYIGSEDNYLYCFNPNGTTNWQSKTKNKIYLSCPAIGNNGKIYMGSLDTNFYCFNPDGTTNWQAKTEGEIWSSAAIGSDGKIYVGSMDGNLYCFNTNGKTNWRAKTGGGLTSSPAIGSDGKIYVGSMDTNFYCFNLNGTTNWKANIGGGTWSSPGIGSDGKIYVGSEDKHLYCFNPNGTTNWRVAAGSNIVASPVIGSDGKIYIGSGDKFYCFNPNGTTNWQAKMGGYIFSSAIGSDGKIYVGDTENRLYCFSVPGYSSGSTSILASTNRFSKAGVYPTYFNLSKFKAAKIYCGGSTKDVEIKVYDIVGNLVRNFGKKKGTEIFEWDGKNDSGQILNSGIYILHIFGNGINTKAKFIVVK